MRKRDEEEDAEIDRAREKGDIYLSSPAGGSI